MKWTRVDRKSPAKTGYYLVCLAMGNDVEVQGAYFHKGYWFREYKGEGWPAEPDRSINRENSYTEVIAWGNTPKPCLVTNLEVDDKKSSVMEALTNTVTGLLVSFLIQIIIYPTLDIKVSLDQNLLITLVFFLASFLRSYVIRRVFSKIKQKDFLA